MSVTILEALENAEINLENVKSMGLDFLPTVKGFLPIVKDQLHNVRILLEKGYSVYDEVEPLLEEYGEVENVPDNNSKAKEDR